MTRKVLAIERATWYRGKGSGQSFLLNQRGEKCCLGFDALACGLTPDDILGIARPDEIETADLPSDYAGCRLLRNSGPYGVTDAVTSAIRHNDDEQLSEGERERLIRADLIALGWDDVVFV